MKISTSFMKTNEVGFGMIELMIAVGILGIVFVGLGSYVNYYAANQATIENTTTVNTAARDIELMLSIKGQCVANLQGLPVGGGAITDLRRYSKPIIDGKPLPARDDANDDVYASTTAKLSNGKSVAALLSPSGPGQSRLVKVAQISDALVSGELQVSMRAAKYDESHALYRSIPLFLQVQGGKIIDCWVKQSSAKLVISQVCLAATGGMLNVFDAGIGECSVANSRWVSGTRSAAKCPAGAALPKANSPYYDCRVDGLDGGTVDAADGVQFTEFPMSDGSNQKMKRSPIITRYDADPAPSTGCICEYAADMPASAFTGAVCQIRCVFP